ncbi:MAG: tRNA 2-thiouridine(34) synthase MnmA [bacterium]
MTGKYKMFPDLVRGNKPKVLVAMSGGVDSSVTAFLLTKQGYAVKGVHFRLISKDAGLEKARVIAKFLNIPYQVVDLREEFKQKVIKPFLKEYQDNKTPNPCVICNPEIKFGVLNQLAVKEGFDYFATGHYARVKKSIAGVKLLKGLDSSKDQSYFLWGLSQKILKQTIFPLGNYTKNEIKSIAMEIGLPHYSDKKEEKIDESQEICFAQEGIECFLKKNFNLKPGNIIDDKGNVLGKHSSLFLYTPGQRKGLGLSGGPYFVLNKNTATNELAVTKNEEQLFTDEFTIRQANWINGNEPKFPLSVKIKTRYRQNEAVAQVSESNKKGIYGVVLAKPQKAIAPGQSTVFYRGEELIGGGIIR